MKKLLPILGVVFALAFGAAAGAGIRLATAGAPEERGADASRAESADKPTKKSGEGHGDASSKSAYMKFSRQFVAPVIKGGVPIGTIILDVSIEIDPSMSQSAYAEEPRLRDAVMDVLLRQGASGRLSELFANPVVLDETKAEVLVAARKTLGEGARSVLIMDIGYQRF